MSALVMRRAVAAALTATILFGASSSAAHAEIQDYEFRLVKAETKKGDAELAVRLVNKKSGRPVPNAVIFTKRIDMAPDGMETMASPIEQLPSTEPGIYRFKTNLSMQGRWQLSPGAKIEGSTAQLRASWSLRRCHETHPLVLAVSVVIMTAGIGGFWLGHQGGLKGFTALGQTQAPLRPSGPVIYYQDPDSKPLYSTDPDQSRLCPLHGVDQAVTGFDRSLQFVHYTVYSPGGR
jgi:hypothetical protein